MLNAKHLFILSHFYLVQENAKFAPLLDELLESEDFAKELEDLYEENYINHKLLPKGYNALHADPRSLNSKQLGFRLVLTLETLYNRKDFTALKYIPVKIKEQIISSLSESFDVIAEFQRTTPKEEVVVKSAQEEVKAVVESKPKKSRKKA